MKDEGEEKKENNFSSSPSSFIPHPSSFLIFPPFFSSLYPCLAISLALQSMFGKQANPCFPAKILAMIRR
jgi:hypothetical protein